MLFRSVGGPTVVGNYHFDDMDSGTYRIYRAFPLPDSTEIPWCDAPLGIIHTYEKTDTDMDGSILESHNLSEQGNALEHFCQYRCDALDDCEGFSMDSEGTECRLRSTGTQTDSETARWYQKVISDQ